MECAHAAAPAKPQDNMRVVAARPAEGWSEAALIKQLQQTPELGFDQTSDAFVLSCFEVSRPFQTESNALIPPPDIGQRFYAQFAKEANQPDRLALPWRPLVECQLDAEHARDLQEYSKKMRSRFARRYWLENAPGEWKHAACVPTFSQMIPVEEHEVRSAMMKILVTIPGKDATRVLAQRALFDTDPEIRALAIQKLRLRQRDEFQDILLAGLRSPWAPVADHAADAIVALKFQHLVPTLVSLLTEPDPTLPYNRQGKSQKNLVVKEMVRINHLRNCMLCHAPSLSQTDLVRAIIPIPGKTVPDSPYCNMMSGVFVRADTTFLRQDFSVMLPVDNPGAWPAEQRFDYFLRERPATNREYELMRRSKNQPPENYPQRNAVLFALRKLSGTDVGTDATTWASLLNKDGSMQNPFDMPLKP